MRDALELNFDPFDRMLLTADGTVTSLLKACTGEPVTARTTRQAGPATLERLLAATGGWWHPDAGLVELTPAEQLIARRASVCGVCSGVAYVLAESLVVPDRFPDMDAERLLLLGASLGRLLAAGRLESHREVYRSPPYEPVRPPSTSAWHRARRWHAARTGSWWVGEGWRW